MPKTRNTESISEIPDDSTTILEKICEKISQVVDNQIILTNAVKQMAMDIKEHKTITDSKMTDLNQAIREVGANVTSKLDTLKGELTDMTKTLDKSNPNKTPTPHDLITDSYTIQIEAEAIKRKNQIQGWKDNLNNRKFAYWNTIRYKKQADNYRTWLSNDPPFIPKKFRSTIFDNEPREQKEAKKELDMQKMKTEIKILESKSSQNQERYLQIDLKMNQEIEKITPPKVGETIMSFWNAETKREEEKSEKMLKEKQEFLDNLPQRQNAQANSQHVQPATSQNNNHTAAVSSYPSYNSQYSYQQQNHTYNQTNRGRPDFRNQNTQWRPRSENHRLPNTSYIQPNTFRFSGPQTQPKSMKITVRNDEFNTLNENVPGRSSQRFLREVENIPDHT